jgi:hypothetical protein
MRAFRWARSRPRQATVAGLAVSALLVFSVAALAGPVGTLSGFEDDDGNLVDNPAAGIDWNSFNPTTWTGTAPNRVSNKTALGWTFLGLEDAQKTGSDSAFAGGTKQDDNCASVIGASAPNKDDLKRAYMATATVGGHVFLNLAWVRIPQQTTSSSAHVGFEFNKAISGNCAGASGLVNRTAGDMLVVYDFEGGGGDPVITLRRWVTSGACEVGSKSAPCWGVATNLTASGVAEAKVNVGAQALDEIAPASETLNDSEFGEAGIDLTKAQVFTPGACESFGKAFAVSRSSGNSGTAQMKDLVGPAPFQIANCSAALTTTPSAGVTPETQVPPGAGVTDLAVVQGTNNAGTPPTPTGNVTFSLCGPTAPNATALCDSGGTQVGSAKALADSSPPPGEASATSDAVNTAASPLAPGRYCFRATWPGDTNYPGSTHVGTGQSECFIVRVVATTTVTTPSNGLGSPLSSPVNLGTILFDEAVVTGSAAAGSPPGTVNFFICDPSQVQGTAGSETCATGGTALSDNPRTLAADLGSSPPTSSVLSSPGVTADKAGVWCFRAVYTPTGSTYTGSSDATHGECVTVSKAPTATVTTPRNGAGNAVSELAVGDSVFDKAVVTGVAAGGTPTGIVAFSICDPSQVQGAAGAETCATGGTALADNPRTLSADAGSAPPSASVTSSPAVVVNKVGTWCFRAVFSPSGSNAGNYLGSNDASHSECFVVKDSTSTSSQQVWLPNDSATVASAGGTALSGTLSFTLYSGDNCGATSGSIMRPAEEFTLNDAASPATRETTNSTVTVSVTSNVSWKVSFHSSDPLVSDSVHCEKTSLTVTN